MSELKKLVEQIPHDYSRCTIATHSSPMHDETVCLRCAFEKALAAEQPKLSEPVIQLATRLLAVQPSNWQYDEIQELARKVLSPQSAPTPQFTMSPIETSSEPAVRQTVIGRMESAPSQPPATPGKERGEWDELIAEAEARGIERAAQVGLYRAKLFHSMEIEERVRRSEAEIIAAEIRKLLPGEPPAPSETVHMREITGNPDIDGPTEGQMWVECDEGVCGAKGFRPE
jgi:hypothetical protein